MANTEKLDESQVRKVANLARLKLADSDVARYATQLTGILGYVAQLKSVDVSGIEPMAHPLPLKNVLREDEVTPSLPVEVALANAPGKDGSFFTVPKVLDTGMGGG
ncbi:MAG TPA: Asp-tRNA(Asn)/Glu-tRNA(Gln) amidotransferase subunit GatC [Phycisphaerae bacterium]